MQHQLAAFLEKMYLSILIKKICSPVSGGVDSMVLLNAMALLFWRRCERSSCGCTCQLWTSSKSMDEEQLSSIVFVNRVKFHLK